MARLLLALSLAMYLVIRMTDGQSEMLLWGNSIMIRISVCNVAISMVSISPSGTNTAGETYSLECSATVTGSADQPTIT